MVTKAMTRTKRTPKEVSEKDIENAILEWLNLLPQCKAWKNQSVGIFDPYKRIYRKNPSKWTARGTADILGIYKGRMICLEVKKPGGRLSPDQKEFLKTMADLGAITGMVMSIDDARLVLETIPDA